MASAVLGKRSRRTEDQDINLSHPTKRRLTRRDGPQIYEDNSSSSKNKHSEIPESQIQNTDRSLRSCKTRTKRIVQNKSIPEPRNATVPAEACDELMIDALKENIPPTLLQTPTAVRFRDALLSTPSSKHRVRLTGKLLTPRLNRTASTPRAQSVYAAARQLFCQTSNPTRLLGRDNERCQLQNAITEAIRSGTGGCTYVSGPPGTGKSALVQEIFRDVESKNAVQASVINCVALKSSSEVLAKLSEDFSLPSNTNRKSIKENLSRKFSSNKDGVHLVLLDEIDSLLDRHCDVLYSMFEWALQPSSSLMLIGIANALDLTDRFLPSLKARGLKPTLLPFLPYTATQISNIITDKLRSLLPADCQTPTTFVPFVHPAAIQLSGKKIASQTGDLRKAFNLIRRAIDQVEQETTRQLSAEQPETPTKQPLTELTNSVRDLPPTPPNSSPLKANTPGASEQSALSRLTIETAPRANIAHVAKLASSIFNNGTVSRLNGLNLQQKAVLCSLAASEHRQNKRNPYQTPSKSWSKIPTVRDLFEKYTVQCNREDGMLQPLKSTEFRDVVSSLETLGLIHESAGRNSSMLTPTKTPSRNGKNADDRTIVSAVSEQELKESLQGPGGDLLRRMFDK